MRNRTLTDPQQIHTVKTMTSKFLYSAIGRADKTFISSSVSRQMRNFFGYLRIAFNKVDTQRLEEVGPDRLCAEW